MLNRTGRRVVIVMVAIVATSSCVDDCRRGLPGHSPRRPHAASRSRQGLYRSINPSGTGHGHLPRVGRHRRRCRPSTTRPSSRRTVPFRSAWTTGVTAPCELNRGHARRRRTATPFDCGCPLEREDSYWIEVADGRGRAVARMHLWAAYGKFQIVRSISIDGPGDELLIVRVPAHSSPPAGYDLKIWKIGETKPVELGGSERVANPLITYPLAVRDGGPYCPSTGRRRSRGRSRFGPSSARRRAVGSRRKRRSSSPHCAAVRYFASTPGAPNTWSGSQGRPFDV